MSMRRIGRWFHKLWSRCIRRDLWELSEYPVIHHFPDVGTNGEVTIDCLVRTTARPADQDPLLDEEPNSRRFGVAPQRVGALLVEVDEYGLHLRWQPAEDQAMTGETTAARIHFHASRLMPILPSVALREASPELREACEDSTEPQKRFSPQRLTSLRTGFSVLCSTN
jgi:hypothetical protein